MTCDSETDQDKLVNQMSDDESEENEQHAYGAQQGRSRGRVHGTVRRGHGSVHRG